MHEIDKELFGPFVAKLRKEKGYTQKELAEKLFISDKAVSKWETSVSIPDTNLLIPLAEIFGISVTELLMCKKIKAEDAIDPHDVESAIKTALNYPLQKTPRAFHAKQKWPILLFCSSLAGCVSLFICHQMKFNVSAVTTIFILSLIFGVYFCFFVKTRLPEFYDHNRCGLYYDGPVRMNVPGVVFTNSNWPYILRCIRVWSCLCLSLCPLINLVMNIVLPRLWIKIELYFILVLVLGGLFIPIYCVGRKYE